MTADATNSMAERMQRASEAIGETYRRIVDGDRRTFINGPGGDDPAENLREVRAKIADIVHRHFDRAWRIEP